MASSKRQPNCQMIWVKSPHLEDDPVNKKDGNDCEAFIVALRHVPLIFIFVFCLVYK
jgi:hypothetical protein